MKSVCARNKTLLALDAGNSRLKWLLRSASGDRRGGVSNTEFTPEMLAAVIGSDSVVRVVISSVNSEQFNNELRAMCKTFWGLEAEFVSVQREYLGVKAAYKEHNRLGVDRWLAMLAAYNYSRRPCIVVDAGTAITVDFVGANGLHLGGLIVPGVQALQRSLLRDTYAVSPKSLTLAQNWQPGCDTVSCVEHGLSASLRGLVEQVKNYSQQLGAVDFFLTGGDSATLEPWFEGVQVKLLADLVMEGALLWLEQQ